MPAASNQQSRVCSVNHQAPPTRRKPPPVAKRAAAPHPMQTPRRSRPLDNPSRVLSNGADSTTTAPVRLTYLAGMMGPPAQPGQPHERHSANLPQVSGEDDSGIPGRLHLWSRWCRHLRRGAAEKGVLDRDENGATKKVASGDLSLLQMWILRDLCSQGICRQIAYA
jgi:hypothetical protein